MKSYQELISIGHLSPVLKYPYLGESFQKNGKKVSKVISETLPNTTILALFAIVIAIVTGIFLGIFSTIYQNSWFDTMISIVSITGIAFRPFFLQFYLPGYSDLFFMNTQA